MAHLSSALMSACLVDAQQPGGSESDRQDLMASVSACLESNFHCEKALAGIAAAAIRNASRLSPHDIMRLTTALAQASKQAATCLSNVEQMRTQWLLWLIGRLTLLCMLRLQCNVLGSAHCTACHQQPNDTRDCCYHCCHCCCTAPQVQLGYIDTPFFSAMADQVAARATAGESDNEDFPPHVMENIAWAFGEAPFYHHGLMKALVAYLGNHRSSACCNARAVCPPAPRGCDLPYEAANATLLRTVAGLPPCSLSAYLYVGRHRC